MFEKCIRGDAGDNVQSAYPRVRRTRILKAYEDEYEKTNIMEHEWTLPSDDGEKKFTVKDLYKENILLMDLEAQPEDIQRLMVETVLHGLQNPGKFSYFNFLHWLGQYGLERVAENLESYVPMLSS